MSNSATSSPTDFCWFCWPQWHTATVCKWVKLVCQQQKYLDTLQHPVFSLGSLRCVVLSPSEYPHGSQSLSSPWCLTPEPEHPDPVPTLYHRHKCGAVSHFLAGNRYSSMFIVVNSLHFAFQAPEPPPLYSPLRFQNSLLSSVLLETLNK